MERVLHQCSVDSTLIWDQEPPCLCTFGCCFSMTHSHTVGPRASGSGWKAADGASAVRDRLTLGSNTTPFHPSSPESTRPVCLSPWACARIGCRWDERVLGNGDKSCSLLTLFRWTLDTWRRRKRRSAELSAECHWPRKGHGSCLEGPVPRVHLTTPEGFVVQDITNPNSSTISAIMSVHKGNKQLFPFCVFCFHLLLSPTSPIVFNFFVTCQSCDCCANLCPVYKVLKATEI